MQTRRPCVTLLFLVILFSPVLSRAETNSNTPEPGLDAARKMSAQVYVLLSSVRRRMMETKTVEDGIAALESYTTVSWKILELTRSFLKDYPDIDTDHHPALGKERAKLRKLGQELRHLFSNMVSRYRGEGRFRRALRRFRRQMRRIARQGRRLRRRRQP